MANYWVVRSDADIRDAVEGGGFVGIGFGSAEIGNINGLSRDEIRQRVNRRRPDAKLGQISADTGMLFRFANEIAVGDWVLTLVEDRIPLIGEITSDYTYVESRPDKAHQRFVKWHSRVSRYDMSRPLRNAIGGIQTVFGITKYGEEILRLLGQSTLRDDASATEYAKVDTAEELTDIAYSQDIEAKARDQIADLILAPGRFDGHEFEEFVAALLTAMNFKIVRGPLPGADGGIDIIVAPDVFGFEQPRIIVQVKHQRGKVGLDDVQRLKGTLRAGEKGLFVSTGGFASGVEKQAGPDVTLLDGEKIVEYFIDHYENMSSEYKGKVPLKRVYLPVPPEETE